MKKTESRNEELDRASLLRSYDILDTAPEESFDEVTMLISEICGAPMAMVSLTDRTRQWFKSRRGVELSEIPRELSFCNHAILQKELFIVTDSTQDERFKNNIFVTGEPYVRFYAASPLWTPEGICIGTLCVMDHNPRNLTSWQIQSLQVLGKKVVLDLEFKKSKQANIFLKNYLIEMQTGLETERMKVRQNAKLATLGELAAGVAHEINNALAIIEGSANLLNKFVNDAEKFQSKVDSIKRSCDRIARIVGSLKKFSGSFENAFAPHPLRRILHEALVLTEANCRRHGISVEAECPNGAEILCHDIEIEQVFVNLINNAVDAIKEQDEKWIRVSVFERDSLWVLQVTDSGHGIPKDIKNKIFEPFFTTKGNGKGTGLGLSIVKGILHEHKAAITVVEDSPHTCLEVCFKKTAEVKNAA